MNRVRLAMVWILWGLIGAARLHAQEGKSAMQILPFPDSKLSVCGLAWFSKDRSLCRLPAHLKGTFRRELWDLAQNPSGGRIRFRTDSEKISIKALAENNYAMYHMTSIGQSGFDLYVDGLYRGSTGPIGPDNLVAGNWNLGFPGVEKEITLYMPLYKSVAIQEIGLDEKASVKKPQPFALPEPVVYYGTSITQGGCASNPGMAYPAILGRRLDTDFVNLGFSGNGWGDLSIAKAITELKVSAIVLDYWANVSAVKMAETLPPFVKLLRQTFPKTPILLIGPYYTSDGDNDELRKVEEDFVLARQKAGDGQITFVDGRTMITRETAYALVDGIHCNTLGFQRMADALEGPLRRALGLELKK